MKERLKEFWQNFRSVLKRPEMAILPGQLAFFFVLSIVPTITIISYGASFLDLPIDFIYNFIEKAFNADIAEMIVMGVSGVIVDFRFYITLIFGFYFASNGADSIIVTSNTIYGIKNSSFIKRRGKAFVMTIFIIFLFLFLLIVPVFGNKIIELVRYVNLNESVTNNIILIFNIVKGPITWLVMFMFIKIIYTLAPDRKLPSRNVNTGALFTTFTWALVTEIFSYYINNYAAYDVFYGSLANIVILMMWFFILAYIFTVGMALNYREEKIKLEKTGQINLKQ